LRCANSGVCAIRTCSTTSPCPTPYACVITSGTSGLCQRPACDAGTCPGGMTCTSALCVEP
jgi:hypothetical protein